MKFGRRPKPVVPLSCAVCRREPVTGAGWYLVSENAWFDRLRILHWHPALAAGEEMKAVCCTQHLELLLGHWLRSATLQCAPTGSLTVAPPEDSEIANGDFAASSTVLGELTVYRESKSQGWSGSPETLECILQALLGQLSPDWKRSESTDTNVSRREPFPLVLRSVPTHSHW